METKKINKVTPFIMATPSLLIGISMYMGSVVIPLTVDRLTRSTVLLSYVVVTGTIAGIIVPYIGGRLSDITRLNMGKRKPWVLFGGIIASIGLIGMGVSSTYILLWISAFVFYIAENFYQAGYYAWMPESVHHSQIGTVNGWGRVFASIGGLFVFGFGVTLFMMNPMDPYYMIVALTMIPVLIVTLGVKDKSNTYTEMQQEEKREKRSFKENFECLKDKTVMRLFIGSSIPLIGVGLITPYMFRYFATIDHFSEVTISTALMGCVIPGLLSVFFGMFFNKITNKKILIIIAYVLEIISCIIAFNITNIGMLWGFTLVFGLGTSLFFVGFNGSIPYVAPKGKLGEYFGIAGIFQCICMIIGQLLGGQLLETQWATALFPIAAVTMVIGCIILAVSKIQFRNYAR